MRKLNKRGFWMGEESGKFILGIIAVVLLLILIFKIAGILWHNTEYGQAKYVILEIENIISSLKVDATEIFLIESPKKWYLISFNKEDTPIPPQDCFKNNCLCLCPSPTKESCEKEGICKPMNQKTWIVGNYCTRLEGLFSKTIPVSNCISLDILPKNINIRLKNVKNFDKPKEYNQEIIISMEDI
jgi:hypothetical protein